MLESISGSFSTENFMPHGHCFLWEPRLLWSIVLGNAIIAVSYFSIPIALVVVTRHRQNDKLKWILVMFGAFIFACGMTHLINIMTIWYPNYYLDAGAKLVTATVSAITAIALWPIANQAKAYISNRESTAEFLQGSNYELKQSLHSLQMQQRDLSRINQMSGYLQICNNIREVSDTVVDTLVDMFPDSCGALYLIADRTGEFEMTSSWGGGRYPAAVAAEQCWAFRTSKPFPENLVQTQQKCSAADCGVRAEKLCLPINAGGETLGLLHFHGLWALDDARAQSLLPLLIERAGFAIFNIRLQQSLEFNSTRDPLTELFNRRYMDEALQVEIERSRRDQKPLSIAMFDLDDFKKLNDSLGHVAGDRALRLFADTVRENLRASDTACRFGGEEFLVLLPGAASAEAVELCERIRRALVTRDSTHEDYGFGLTVSVGVATTGPQLPDKDELLKRADEALYQAKNGGKNRVNSTPGGPRNRQSLLSSNAPAPGRSTSP